MKTTTDSPQEKQFKLLLIGEQAVGKSSLMNRYVDNVFEVNIMGTAGLDLKKKVVEINKEKVKVYIFDTAGQERFRTIAKNQYKKADAIIIIYDVTDRKSFECVKENVNQKTYKCYLNLQATGSTFVAITADTVKGIKIFFRDVDILLIQCFQHL